MMHQKLDYQSEVNFYSFIDGENLTGDKLIASGTTINNKK